MNIRCESLTVLLDNTKCRIYIEGIQVSIQITLVQRAVQLCLQIGEGGGLVSSFFESRDIPPDGQKEELSDSALRWYECSHCGRHDADEERGSDLSIPPILHHTSTPWHVPDICSDAGTA